MKNIRLNSARLRINSTALFYAVGRKILASSKTLSALGLLAAAFGSAFAVTTPPGSLDTSFGVGGTVVLPLVNTTLPAGDQLTAMAVQSDGKILVAGQCLKPYGFAACVTRLNADGSVDRTGFGFDNTYADKPALLAVASNGDILVASSCRTSTNLGLGPGFCAERFTSSGLSVPGFADPPAVIGGIRRVIAAYSDELEAMAIQPDGKIVLVGKCATTRLLDTYNFCVMRVNADGSPDSSFTGPNGSSRKFFNRIRRCIERGKLRFYPSRWPNCGGGSLPRSGSHVFVCNATHPYGRDRHEFLWTISSHGGKADFSTRNDSAVSSQNRSDRATQRKSRYDG
jgi:uncharacterized delta-60 repeat protein